MALREAVVEQIMAAKMGQPRLVDTAQACLKQLEECSDAVIVADNIGTEKDIAALLAAFKDKEERLALFVLGDEDSDGVTESFAKPFRLGHLLARLRYYLETAPLLRDRAVFFGAYRLEPKSRHVIYKDNPESIRLTEKETALLVFLARCTEPVTRRDILAGVWGYDEKIDTHTLETHIYQLRRKLDQSGDNWLINEAGAYRLVRGQD